METTYITSATKPEQLPPFNEPEVAFIGRSNAGKSSLLNTLVGRKALAREGKTPGRTQMINFFSLNKKVILADLPGYGFRTTPKSVSIQWEELVESYISRPNIKHVFFLMDCRREVGADDILVLKHFNARTKPIVVLTKCDKVSKNELSSLLAKIVKKLAVHKIAYAEIVTVSVLNKLGIDSMKEKYLDCYLKI